MFEKIVQRVINRIMGEYIENFNSDNLKIGIWSGEVSIQNVRLRADAIKKLNLPLKIKYSRLGCLKMSIPWSSLGSSKIDILIEGLELIVYEVKQQFWQCKNNKIIEHRKKQIQQFCDSIIADFAKKSSAKSAQENEQGYFASLAVKIIDNVQVVVRDIHVRFQDYISNKFSLGVTLEELKIFTVNQKGKPEFIDRTKKGYENQPLRKKLELSNFGIYWNESSSFFSNLNPHEEMVRSIAKKNDLVENKIKYLLLMSSNAMLYLRDSGKQFEEPEINLRIEFDELRLKITNSQLQQIVNLGERLQKYSNNIKAQNRKKLTHLQILANKEVFMKIFPSFFEKKCGPQELRQFQEILQKMEVEHFEEPIRKFLQTKQKEKMIQEKIQKNQGWFSKSKELTEEQVQEIEKFLTANFGKEVKSIKRPEDYFYLRVDFNLKSFELSVSNQKLNHIKEGIKLKFIDIKIGFHMREQGHLLDFAMNDITLDLFEEDQESQIQETVKIVQKRVAVELENKQYVRFQVIGNPLNKKHLNQEIVVRTQQLLIHFHPRIVRIAQQFMSIKLNSQNSEAALEVYGELKHKAEVAATQSLKKPFQRKNLISLDIKVNAISLILFFNPLKTQNDIWLIKLGELELSSDQQLLKVGDFSYDEPMEKYNIKFKDMSLTHHANKNLCFNSLLIDRDHVIKQLSVDFQIQLFKDLYEKTPKIRVKSLIHKLNLKLTAFIFQSLQKLHECFEVSDFGQNTQRQKVKMLTKAQIMKEASKIGIVYEQSAKQSIKYIGVVMGSYLYLYKDKKDLEYSAYYSLRKCEITYNQQTNSFERMFEVKFKNVINEFVLCFEKIHIMEEWIRAIMNASRSEEAMKPLQGQESMVKKIESSREQNPNKLNFEIMMSVEQILLTTKLQQQKSIVLCVRSMDSRIRIHEQKNILDFSLLSIQIIDNLHTYKYQELNSLLYSTAIQGKQKLIEINIINYAKTHPDYSNIEAIIYAQFGKLICNYKPETIQRLMNFYLPKDSELANKKKQKGSALTVEEKLLLDQEKKQKRQHAILTEIQRKIPEIFLFKLRLKIDQISASMINQNNKVMFAAFGLTRFDFSLTFSPRRILLGGQLREIWLADYSRYPYTIYEEQEHYRSADYIVESYNSMREMLKFNIELLEIANDSGKSMMIEIHLRDLKVSYIQQPVLRIITYLLQQVLPSLTPPEDLSEPKVAPRNDIKPQAAPFTVRVNIENVLAIAQPRCQSQEPEFLQLNVSHVVVINSTHLRDYILDKKDKEQSVLVENYTIKIGGVRIIERLGQKETKLTNDLDLQVSCDLIQNPQYYRKIYENRFDAGMRIECRLTPFLMCINHNNYNFIMKCLFWNITYDDNAEGYFFPSDKSQAVKQSRIQASRVSRIIAELNQPPSEPIHVGVDMSKILVCVTEKGFPLSVLLLNQMRYDLTLDEVGMFMVFKLKHLFGTTIVKTDDPRVALERGMFNSFGYQKKHRTDLLYDMENFQKAFWPNVLMQQEKQSILTFTMTKNNKANESSINLKIGQLGIAIEMKTLQTLSQLALLEDYTQPPPSEIKPAKLKPQTVNLSRASMMIKIEMSNFLGCLGDRKFQNYIVMEGIFQLRLKLFANLTQQTAFAQASIQERNGTFRQSSSYQVQVRGFSLYFSNVHNLKNKRFLLLPFNCFVFYRTFYSKIRESVFLQSEIDGMIDRIIFQCSSKDILILNQIAQDNISSLANDNTILHQPSNTKNTKPEKNRLQNNKQNKNEISIVNQSVEIDTRALERTIFKGENKVRNKSKGTLKLEPIQIRIVNDCGHNFMPILNFQVQQSCLRFVGDSIRQMLELVLIVKLDFFNLRSACWEPILESFQFSLEHVRRKVGNELKTTIGIFSSNSQLNELKLNISTQLIMTMSATFQIIQKQKRSLEEINNPKQKQVSEISPYIIENRSNYIITVLRKVDGIKNDFQVRPFFKGQLRLDDGQMLQFRFKNKVYQTSVERFGYVCVPGLIDLHLEFQIDKLNRVICFVDRLTIKNSTSTKIYCMRYNEKHEKIEENVTIQPGQAIPFKKQWYAQFSFNMKTFTPPHKGQSLAMMSEIRGESERFKLNVNTRQTIQAHEIISLKAPFCISNCLPKNIKVQFISNAKYVSTRQILAQTCHEVFANEQLRQFKFKILAQGFYWSQQFTLDASIVGKQQTLLLTDRDQGGTTIKFLFEEDPKNGQCKLSIFCSAFILSELEDNIHIYGNLNKEQKSNRIQRYELLGGQTQFWKRGQVGDQLRMLDKITLVGESTGSKLRICGCNCLIDFSEPFSINSIGIHQARVVVEREVGVRKISVFTILGVDIQLKKMAMHSNIFSKQITVRYRHIISNTTDYQLLIKQHGSSRLFFSALKGEKKPFFFSVPLRGSQQRTLIIKTPETKESQPIHSDVLGSTFFRLEIANRRGEYLYFKASTYQIQSYLFCQISSVKYEDLPYQVEIKSDKFKIYVPAFEKVLTMNRYPLCFINEKPEEEHKLFILLTLIETEQAEEALIEVDNLNFKKVIRFTHKLTGQVIVAYIHVDFSDSKKLIIVEQLKSDTENVVETELQNIRLRLEKLSVSFIQNHGSIDKPYESFYFYMQNLEMAFLKTNLSTKFQAKLQFLQFDQCEPFNIPDPVIVTPSKYKQFTSKNPKDKPKSVFNLLVELDRKFVKNNFFKVIAVQINDIVVRTTTYFIKLAMQLIKQYNDVFKSESEFLINKQIDTWRHVAIPSEQSNTYINSIQIGPFTVEISTEVRLNELDVESVVFFGTIINALGVVITNIQNAPIVFEGIALDNCVDSIQGIQQKLIVHYKQSVMKQLYKVFGSLNIIGNPVGLFRNISTGIKAMKEKPAQGFVKGPLQFSKGLADGTSSLIAHSVGGALNSVQKITGTFASGLAVLSFDKQFEENREKQKLRKPKHLLEGLQKGGKAVFHGFKEGIAGVVTKPIQQTKKGGAVGLFKGMAKGITGLVIKPVTGIVDFASKTTEGLKNTALYLEDKPNESRIRNPRTFYTECGFIEEYNDIDSMLLAIVCKYEQKYCSKSPPVYMSAFAINQEQFLLVLKDDIMMINISDERIEWAIPLGVLSLSKESDDQIRVRTDRNMSWTVKKINAVIEFTSKGQMNRFVKMVQELKINMNSNLMIENSFY